MSRYDYLKSIELGEHDPSFASLIMACARKADDINMIKLQACWPDIVKELQRRYNSPAGILPEEKEELHEEPTEDEEEFNDGDDLVCSICSGLGYDPRTDKVCTSCHGQGWNKEQEEPDLEIIDGLDKYGSLG